MTEMPSSAGTGALHALGLDKRSGEAHCIDSRYIERRYREEREVKDPHDFLPLPSATLHILVALTTGEKHGYAIMGEVEALSDGAVRMGPGTLYGSIKRLLADGLIEESDERPDAGLDDQRRRYYRLTSSGEQVCAAELRRLEALIRRAGSPQWARRYVPRLGEA
jgi:DNA-binding PadR family transcriptional regulator